MSDIHESSINGYVNTHESVSSNENIYSAPAKVIYPCDSALDFPTTGKTNALYIDKSTTPNVAYRWDPDLSGYVPVGGGDSGGGVNDYEQLQNLPTINGVTVQGNMTPENIGAFPMFTGTDETDPDTSLKGLMFVQCSDELKEILGMPRAYIYQCFYSTSAIAENQTRAQIAIAYGDVAKMAIRQYYGSPKAWTPWVALSGAGGSDITIDSELSDESENPVQNKVIAEALDSKADSSDIPESLPNPESISFAGAVTAEYNGAEAVTVVIPEEIAVDITEEEAAAQGAKLLIDTSALPDPNSEFITAENVEAVVSNFVGDVLLWSSSDGWSSGSLTVPGLSSYRHLVFEFGDVFVMEGLNNGSTVRGGNSICTSGAVYSYGFYFSVSGNTLTRTYVKRALHTNGETNTVENYTGAVTAIYGRRIKAVN